MGSQFTQDIATSPKTMCMPVICKVTVNQRVTGLNHLLFKLASAEHQGAFFINFVSYLESHCDQ